MGRRIALLIGNQEFSNESGLDALRGAKNDVDELAAVLRDRARGGFHVSTFLEQPHHALELAIVEALQAAAVDDFVLIYYSGHGKLSPSGKLYLATANTKRNALQGTALSAWSLHEAVSDSACREVVLLLDCCYSGAVSQGLRGSLESQLQAVQNASGFFILTASTGLQTALEIEGDFDGKVMGKFTAAIVEGIRSGAADVKGTGEIRLTDLRLHVERSLRGQTPQLFVHAGSGDPLISLANEPMLDALALEDLDSVSSHRRYGAVMYLRQLVERGNLREKEAARRHLIHRQGIEQDAEIRQAISGQPPQRSVGDADHTRDALQRGIDAVANAAKETLGPEGRRVIIGKTFGSPEFAQNGLEIAKRVKPTDGTEMIAAELACEAAANVQRLSGDGVSTMLVLAQALVRFGFAEVALGRNPMDLCRGLDQAAQTVIERLRSSCMSSARIPLLPELFITKRSDDLFALLDARVFELVELALKDVAATSLFVVSEPNYFEITMEFADSLSFDKGYISPYFITNADATTVELAQPCILILDERLSTFELLVPILEAVMKSNRSLLIIANGVEGQALSSLVINKLRSNLRVAAVNSPTSFAEPGSTVLEDIATLTHSKVIGETAGTNLEKVTFDMLGSAQLAIVTDARTTLICDVAADNAMQERIAKQTDRVAIIKVGGNTEKEIKQRLQRVNGIVRTMQALSEEGAVAGGGVALVRAAAALDGLSIRNEDQAAGVGVMRRALDVPFRQIAANAGMRETTLVEKLLENSLPSFGLDVSQKEWCDLAARGILDPLKTVRVGLEAAVTLAGSLITTGQAFANSSEPNGQLTPT